MQHNMAVQMPFVFFKMRRRTEVDKNQKSLLLGVFMLLGTLIATSWSVDVRKNATTRIKRDVIVDPTPSRTSSLLVDGRYPNVTNQKVPEECTLVMAKSSIPNSGWGVFTLTNRRKGQSLFDGGDVVIQIPDIIQHSTVGMRKLIWEYLWSSEETGGQFEGQYHVMSFVPGIGSLANGDGTTLNNVLPSIKPTIDNAGINRQSSPGAGGFTHYHNFTWYVSQDMEAAAEIFVNFGSEWFHERGLQNSLSERIKPSLKELRQEGYCLDNLRPGISTIPHVGRGCFATRRLIKGAVVAPVPVLPVSSASLSMTKHHESGKLVTTQQLLRNYCFGHSNSSLLLLPYSNMVNLINHYPKDGCTNVLLQWSESSRKYFSQPTEVLQESPTQLLLELVALRDIEEGEEIYLDYGMEWTEAWNNHIKEWNSNRLPTSSSQTIITSQEMNQRHDLLRTVQEQKSDPYPDNIFVTCCYHYLQDEKVTTHESNSQQQLITGEWTYFKGIYESRNLRPCLVLDRSMDERFYTVRLMNHPGLSEDKRIPRGMTYIVKEVPRNAIQFSDKLYTTDQHIETAFRHHIGLGDDTFPQQWMDLNIE